MRVSFSFFFSFFLVSNYAIAQLDKSIKTLNNLAKCTIVLYEQSSGTGNLIQHNEKYFLVTAKHVASQLGNGARMVFSVNADDTPITKDLIFFSKDLPIEWKHHPKADVSILEIKAINKEWEQLFAQIAFSSENIPTVLDYLPRGEFLHFFGFPQFDPNTTKLSPVNFSAQIASGITSSKLLANDIGKPWYYDGYVEYFYLDNPSMQGASGSGVYLGALSGKALHIIDNKVTLMLGLITHTMGDETGGKLGIVMPSYYIWDLLPK